MLPGRGRRDILRLLREDHAGADRGSDTVALGSAVAYPERRTERGPDTVALGGAVACPERGT